jgi:hypothetical protein
MAGIDFAAFTATLPALIASTPGTTVGATQQGQDRYRADCTAAADPTNLLIPHAAELIYPQRQEAAYAPLVESFVASLRPRQP